MRLALSSFFVLATLAGCDGSSGGSPDASSSAPTTSAAAPGSSTTTAASEPPVTPDGLDVAALEKTLKCAAKAKGACAVLAEFRDCVEWNPVTQSGDGRWLGNAYTVEKGAASEDFALLRSRGVPLSEVGPGQLSAKIGIGSIPDELSAERLHAPKAIRAYARGDVPQPTNAAIRYLKERRDWPEAFVMRAKDNQVYVAMGGGAHLCAKGDQRLLMVQRAGDREHRSDGIYAELWPVTW
jgi:hypothetical protein